MAMRGPAGPRVGPAGPRVRAFAPELPRPT